VTRAARYAGALAWLAALALLGVLAARELEIGADLRLFLPTPTTAAERLLVEEVGEGPAARLLLVAISGGDSAARADASRELGGALRDESAFRRVANGDDAHAALDDALLPYRYLLTPSFDLRPLDTASLADALRARLDDLASPLGAAIEPWLPRDPTLELLTLAERWQGPIEIAEDDGVWVSRDGTRALLALETVAAGFDPDAQGAALATLDRAFAEIAHGADLALEVSGPGRFAATIKAETQRDARRLSIAATLGMLLLTLAAYRSASAVLLAALPLASAAVAGLAAVAWTFGDVHGITLAFGATLIGVAQDYPIHLLSHQHPSVAPRANARALWPTLATGVASTSIAYAAFLVSGVAGLAQLGTFTIVGLAAAAATTRMLVPALIDPAMRDRAAGAALASIERALDAVAVKRAGPVAAGLAVALVAAIMLPPGPIWQNDLAALTPLPRETILRDAGLRAELGAPDARNVLVLEARDADEALARLEALEPELERLVAAGALAGYDHAARYLPSRATQLARRAHLPDEAALRAMLAEAVADLPFDAATFEPFVADVARARTLEPLTPERLAATPLGPRLESLLLAREPGTTALVTLSGLMRAPDVAEVAARAGATLLDMKVASETLVGRYRERILVCLALAAVVLTTVVLVALRSARRTLRVLLPMALSTLATLAALRLLGIPLSLFHLIALVLAAGLGLDYALFFEHAGAARDARRRTLHGLVVCAASTLFVFLLLATSRLPVLRAIGLTVSLGVAFNFVFALAFARTGARDARP